MQVILLTAMEYLRDDKVEKEEDTGTLSNKIRTIVVEGCSDKTETSSEDVEVDQPMDAWPDQKKKLSWVDWIKTIGKIQYWIYIIPPDI